MLGSTTNDLWFTTVANIAAVFVYRSYSRISIPCRADAAVLLLLCSRVEYWVDGELFSTSSCVFLFRLNYYYCCCIRSTRRYHWPWGLHGDNFFKVSNTCSKKQKCDQRGFVCNLSLFNSPPEKNNGCWQRRNRGSGLDVLTPLEPQSRFGDKLLDV